MYEFIIKEQELIEVSLNIENESNNFADRLVHIDKTKNIVKNLYDIFYRLYGLSVGDYNKIAELIYSQSYLAILLSTAFYQSVQPHLKKKDGEPLRSIRLLIEKYGKKDGLRKAFQDIIDIDYKPIYNTALSVIDTLPEDNLLDNVINLGIKLGSDSSLLKRDISGRIYHRIIGEWSIRKNFATYFTTIPAAYLLSDLTVFSEFHPMKDPENIKVCDFACGSGTLLNAAYSSLEDLYTIEQFKVGEMDLNDFHRKLLENNFWGFDALRYALQIASLNLVFHRPEVSLRNMNFFAIPLGVIGDFKRKEKNVVLGSLKFLKANNLIKFFEIDEIAKRSSTLDTLKTDEKIPDFEYIIMNPPFTRATGRGGKEGGGLFGFILDVEIREDVLKEYSKLRNYVKERLLKIGEKYLEQFKEVSFQGIGAAGEGLLFIFLAFQYLKENGKIAFVLPRSLLSGTSWFLARTLLLERFHIEYVIVSYDKDQGYNFSESTNLSEVLVVARKTNSTENKPTKFVMLLKKPQTSFDAKALASAITKDMFYVDTDTSSAYINVVSKEEISNNVDNWGKFVSFPNTKIIKFIENLEKGELFGSELPMIQLTKIATIGIDRHEFSNNFKVTKKQVPHSYSILYSGKEEQRTYMFTNFNAYAIPKNDSADSIFNNFSSILLVPDRIRITTSHIISLIIKYPTLSNVFYAVRLKNDQDEKKYKALCVWLNSTFGMLTAFANREETEGAWISLKLSHWRLLKVLDIEKLNKNNIEKLAKIFDAYKSEDFGRIPSQYNLSKNNKCKFEFDKEILNALEIKYDEKELMNIYNDIYQSFNQWFSIKDSRNNNKQSTLL